MDLLRERSVRTGRFTLASGKTSSFYVDARMTTMSAEGLELIGDLGLAAIRRAGWPVGLIGGLTMGADPVAYAIARASRLAPPTIDAFSVRKEIKPHGTSRRIEGCFSPDLPAVIAEDVVTSGQSALTAVRAVTAAGGRVSGIVAVVDREEGGRQALEQEGLPVIALVTAGQLGVRI
ncbi:MAG TPA: orotate phosphoribosyltransferase [Gemmatimonadales bacterium]|nr:orotate phosphoribosyltransferase [Gemmatimonadales bacterium]